MCDNGPEFNYIEGDKILSPSDHPQANSILERFHRELAKMCRIHNCSPVQAVKYLRSLQSKVMLFSELKIRFSEQSMSIIDYKV